MSRKFPPQKVIPDANTTESKVIMMNIAKIRKESSALADVEAKIHETASKKDREMALLRSTSQKQIADLELKLKREVDKRDNIIVAERNEYIRKNKEHTKEVHDLQERSKKDLIFLEVGYEKKLAKESEYLKQMQQAYDEFVVHAKLDLAETNEKWKLRIAEADEHSVSLDSAMDKNKALLMMYCEYVSSRYQEVMSNMQESYEEKLSDLHIKLREANKSADSVLNENKSIQLKMARDVRTLHDDIANREIELSKVKGELDWSREKVARLEDALQSATVEISRRSEECSRWEYKAGEQQQHLSELEKIRKALISQLHLIRQELRPKDEKLAVISQDLIDGEREYASALEALSEKKREMNFQEEKVHLLQKQNRDLRSRVFAKETSLNRAANLFAEYKMALKQAYFDRKKVTVGDMDSALGKKNGFPDSGYPEDIVQNGMIEIIAKNKGMEAALGRLDKILSNHGSDDKHSTEVKISNKI
jgi:chromosome segregation ATPase